MNYIYLKRISFLFLVCVLLISNINAQKSVLRGRVTDECGNGISKVSMCVVGVLDKKIKFMFMSDSNGYFNCYNNFNTIALLNCSHVNYEKTYDIIDGNNIINIILKRKHTYEVSLSVNGKHLYSTEELRKLKSDSIILNDENENIEHSRVYNSVEIQAQFPGWDGALKKYLQRNIIYPDSATISDVKGTVKVRACIGKNGKVAKVDLIKGVNKYCDEAVINVVLKMPKWSPAIQNGLAVESWQDIAVDFNIVGKMN